MQLNTNFQDGCSTIAAAITSKGVTTASNASPSTMATNIKAISTGKTVIDLGTGTSFNVSSYTGFANFTVDNFSSSGVNSVYKKVDASSSGHSGSIWNTIYHVKSYASSTGILTAYSYATAGFSSNYDGRVNGGSATSTIPVRVFLIY